ncbi:MAG: c-type cytochrome [Planctomycetes bacterium]|nr:c-type cytochrome [Planctomycetota bacterium]
MVLASLPAATAQAQAQDAPPKSLDSRLQVQLFAEHPQIVTPTGIDVDARGRVWAVESNTHFPPADYKGHPTDRVLVLSDSTGDGKADQSVVFVDGLKFTMSVAVKPRWARTAPNEKGGGTGGVYIATRREIRLFHDDDGDDRADRSEPIARLETRGDYPHNGLAGFAFDARGWLYFGCGENLGADYTLVGADGTTFSGGGEGGSLYRCRLDGTQLERVATGFWNPHANCCDAFGHLFSVDNDPDSRPPCRLLEAIPQADFGYRFRNGRKGLHPFTAWNGEIPGTLPMVAGTGEAPSGVLAYESDGFPEEYTGQLLATSWGDHRIDRFRLQPRGTSFSSNPEPLIVGGENFRPVGIACAPDGSVYFTDWVKRDYTLHGHGRIWRIAPVEARKTPVIDLATIPKRPADELTTLTTSRRLDVRRLASQTLAASSAGRALLFEALRDRARPQRERVEALWALAQAGSGDVDLKQANLFTSADSVAAAAGWLIGTPELALDQATARNLAEALVAERLGQRTSRLVDGSALLGILAQCSLAPGDRLVPLALSIDDPFLMTVIVQSLTRHGTPDGFARYLAPGSNAAPRVRIATVLAARLHAPKDTTLVTMALGDHDPDVRRLAVQWVAEEKLADLRPRVEAVFNSASVTADLFMATLAALEMLDGANPAEIDKTPAAKYVLPLLTDERRSPAVRAQALRLVAPNDPALTQSVLETFLKSGQALLTRETIQTLQLAGPDRAAPLLLPFAADSQQNSQQRADAVAGLAAAARAETAGGPIRRLLAEAMTSQDASLRLEGLRSARGLFGSDSKLRDALLSVAGTLKSTAVPLTDAQQDLVDQLELASQGEQVALPAEVSRLRSRKPANKAEWLAQLNRGRTADPEAGRRLFFHTNGPGCYKCHLVNGRGGRVGPDLSRIVESMNRIQMIQSILDPSSEIAPQFVSWSFEITDGRVVTGMIVHENEGKTVIGDAEGKLTEFKTIDIVQRVPQAKSVMPEKLTDLLTLQEFRDLLAYLESLK